MEPKPKDACATLALHFPVTADPWKKFPVQKDAKTLRPLPAGGPQETDTASRQVQGARSNGLGKVEEKPELKMMQKPVTGLGRPGNSQLLEVGG